MSEVDKEKNERLKLQKKFGNHLVKVREEKLLSAAELGRLCFMERSTIARLETGRTNPSLFVLHKLAKGLNISLNELLKGFEEKK